MKILNIFDFNLLFNGIQFAKLVDEGIVEEVQNIKGIGIALVYFNFIAYISIIYMKIVVLNPKWGQN